MLIDKVITINSFSRSKLATIIINNARQLCSYLALSDTNVITGGGAGGGDVGVDGVDVAVCVEVGGCKDY